MSYPMYILSYADWKVKRTALAGVTYYVNFDNSYIAIVISQTAERVEIYRANIIKNSTDPNLADFESAIKPSAVVKTSVDDIIAADLLAATAGQEPMVRVAFGSVPSSYGAGAQLVTTGFRNILQIRNNTDAAIVISLDGVIDHFQLGSGEIGSYTGVAMVSGATVRIKDDGVSPTSGEVVMSAWSDA